MNTDSGKRGDARRKNFSAILRGLCVSSSVNSQLPLRCIKLNNNNTFANNIDKIAIYLKFNLFVKSWGVKKMSFYKHVPVAVSFNKAVNIRSNNIIRTSQNKKITICFAFYLFELCSIFLHTEKLFYIANCAKNLLPLHENKHRLFSHIVIPSLYNNR